MSDDVSQMDVLNVLDRDEAKTSHQITNEIHDSDMRCPECLREYEDYKRTESAVRDALNSLVDKNRVIVTADWHYRRARRATDEP